MVVSSMMFLLVFLMFVGVVIGGVVLLIYLSNLSNDIRKIKVQLAKLETRISPATEPPRAGEAGRPGAPEPAEPASAPPSSPEPARRVAGQDKFRLNLEELIGGNWLNRIGIVAVIFAIAFFLKYAFDNQWIGETGRVMIGLIAGLIFIGLGWRYENRGYRYFSQGLTGGGIGILYLSIYAAFGFYHLIPQGAAFGFMILVTAASVVLAVWYNALPIAMLASLGGFLTPFLLSTDVDNQVLLFSYILCLNLGILSIAYFRKWHLVNYQNFILTIITFAAWAERFYAPSKLWPTVFFLTVFFIVFAVLAILHNIVNRRTATAPELILAFLNAGLYFAAMYFLLDDTYGDYLGLFSLAVAGVYVVLAYFTDIRNTSDRFLIWVFLGLALTFVSLAVPIQLDQNWITIGWAVEGALLVYIGCRYKSRNTQLIAMAILALALFRLLVVDVSLPHHVVREEFIPMLNRRALSYVVGIAATLCAAYLFAVYPKQLPDENRIAAGVLLIAANVLAIVLLSAESHDLFEYLRYQDKISGYVRRYAQQLSLSVVWTLYAMFLIAMGIWKKYAPLRYMALVLFGITIFKVFLIDLSTLKVLYRIISFMVLGLILIAVSFLYQKYIVSLVEPKPAEEEA
jgi:uncharacterized membrane protein